MSHQTLREPMPGFFDMVHSPKLPNIPHERLMPSAMYRNQRDVNDMIIGDALDPQTFVVSGDTNNPIIRFLNDVTKQLRQGLDIDQALTNLGCVKNGN